MLCMVIRCRPSVMVMRFVYQVSATDVDQDHSTSILYSFAPESTTFSNLFMIDPNHGCISTLVPLDRETRSVYEFYVLASDEHRDGALASEAKVKVELLDVNDSPPMFTSSHRVGKEAGLMLLRSFNKRKVVQELYAPRC